MKLFFHFFGFLSVQGAQIEIFFQFFRFFKFTRNGLIYEVSENKGELTNGVVSVIISSSSTKLLQQRIRIEQYLA
jgi:hypothetical protein